MLSVVRLHSVGKSLLRSCLAALCFLPFPSVIGAAQQTGGLEPPEDVLGDEEFPGLSDVVLPDATPEQPEQRGCNVPSYSVDASLTNDNRRTTGLVLAEGGYWPPVQQSMLTARLNNVQCRKADGEISMSYSLHDARVFEEKQFRARGMFEPIPRVHVYGGIAYYLNPEGLFKSRSVFLIGGAEYPTAFGAMLQADYLRDVKENGDWLTVQIMKRHRLGRMRRGAVFYYRHGFGATGTRKLPGNEATPDINGIPSVFYRAILEIDDGPVTWYIEASPHVSFVSRATGVRDRHFLFAVGMRFDIR